MTHIAPVAIFAALLVPGIVAAQDWDSDASGTLSRDEWNAGVTGSGAFAGWDADISGMIDSDEFSGGLYSQFDSDGDTTLSSTEWGQAMQDLYGEVAGDLDFADWDADADGFLSRDEFSQEFLSSGLYDATRTMGDLDLSSDGISEDQFGDATFDMMDRNRDQLIGADEGALFR